MAIVLKLTQPITRPAGTLDSLLSVSDTVGVGPHCRNAPEDVLAVQRLLALCGSILKFGPPAPNGVLDAKTAFYIYQQQYVFDKNFMSDTIPPIALQDPNGRPIMRGAIINLNFSAALGNKVLWLQLLESYQMQHKAPRTSRA